MAEWRPVPDYPDYLVSDEGEVVRHTGGQGATAGRVLKPYRNKRGYCSVSLYQGNSGRRRYVHHLVLTAFVGPCPEGMEACHGNDIKDDNRLSNLRWDTHSENHKDRVRLGNYIRPERDNSVCRNGLHAMTDDNITMDRGWRLCSACLTEKNTRRSR